MNSEPTAIIGVIRVVVLVAGIFGIVVTEDEQAVVAAAIGGLLAAASVLLTIWNRSRVFAPATVQDIADRAAVSGIPDIGSPPKGPAGG